MLSLVAGMVNIIGVLLVNVLTTNITGYFAYFAEHFFLGTYGTALMFLLYILCFLLGAFTSNLLIEIANTHKPHIAHALPMFIEVALLVACALGLNTVLEGNAVACVLLYAMGLQNVLVTQVSQSTVRTTHLTGLFTDLGIEHRNCFSIEKTRKGKGWAKVLG